MRKSFSISTHSWVENYHLGLLRTPTPYPYATLSNSSISSLRIRAAIEVPLGWFYSFYTPSKSLSCFVLLPSSHKKEFEFVFICWCNIDWCFSLLLNNKIKLNSTNVNRFNIYWNNLFIVRINLIIIDIIILSYKKPRRIYFKKILNSFCNNIIKLYFTSFAPNPMLILKL